MFDVGWSELILIFVVALFVIGPKDLPTVMYKIGKWIGQLKAMTRQLTSGIQDTMRDIELDEMKKAAWKRAEELEKAGLPDAEEDDRS